MADIQLTLSPTILAIILALGILVLGGLSAAFIYHWREYGLDSRIIKTAPIVYLSVSAGLCIFALIAYFALI